MLDYSLDNISKRYGFTLTPLRKEVMNTFLRKGNSLKANEIMCAGHDVRVEGSSPSWADIERSIS